MTMIPCPSRGRIQQRDCLPPPHSLCRVPSMTEVVTSQNGKRHRQGEKEARLTYERTLLNLEDKVKEDVNELSLIRTRISHEKLIGEKIKEEIKVKRNLWQTGSAGEEELLKKELEGLTSSLAVKGQMIDFYTIYYSLEYMTGGDL
jgi:hypothetical protein